MYEDEDKKGYCLRPLMMIAMLAVAALRVMRR